MHTDGSTIALSAAGKTIRYFFDFEYPEDVNDPKHVAGWQQATGTATIEVDAPFMAFDLSIKARIFDPVEGFSGLTEAWFIFE